MAACRSQLLGLVLSLCLTGLRADGVTRCWIPSVHVGEPTNITCNFAEDVRLTNRNVKIQRQPLTASNGDTDEIEDVLFCFWETKENLKCEPREGDGYQIVETPTNKAVLRIATATMTHVGKYTCQTLPSTSHDIHPCFFVLKGTSDTAAVYKRVESLSDELAETRETLGERVQLQTALLVVVLILFLLAVIAGVLVFVFHERVRGVLKKCRSPKANDEEATRPNSAEENAEITHQPEGSGNAASPADGGRKEGNESKETDRLLSSKDTSDSGAPQQGSTSSKTRGGDGASGAKKKDTASKHRAPEPPKQDEAQRGAQTPPSSRVTHDTFMMEGASPQHFQTPPQSDTKTSESKGETSGAQEDEEPIQKKRRSCSVM